MTQIRTMSNRTPPQLRNIVEAPGIMDGVGRSRRSPFTVHRSPFVVHRLAFGVHTSPVVGRPDIEIGGEAAAGAGETVRFVRARIPRQYLRGINPSPMIAN